MDEDEALKQAVSDREEAEALRDRAVVAANDFARALREVTRPGADVHSIASNALAQHPDYDTP
jgi:hypothetical protein